MTGTDRDTTTDDGLLGARLLHEAGLIVAGWPRVRHRLWSAHQPDAGGRCRACATQTRLAPVWPCTLALLARTGEPHRDRRGAPG